MANSVKSIVHGSKATITNISEAFASELLEKLEEMIHRYQMDSYQ